MSDHRAIAAVSATLTRVLQEVLNEDVPDATAKLERPHAPVIGAPPSVSIFLYQVTPNTAFRNADLPTRRADGQLLRNPQVALNLHYLLSFYGDESRLEPQLMLGSVLRALHAQPLLTPEMIEATVGDPLFDFVEASDLATSVESLKLSLATLSLEDLSKLWSVFFQVPYALSVAFEGSVVLIEKPVQVRATLPVRKPLVHTVLLQTPVITALLSRSDSTAEFAAGAPIVSSSSLLLRGSQLQGPDTRVLFGALPVAPSSVSPTEVVVDVPPTLRAGSHQLSIVHSLAMGEPPQARRMITSEPVAFSLRPTITDSEVDGDEIVVDFSPAAGRTQRVVLLLRRTPSPTDGSSTGVAIEAPARPPSAPEQTAQLAFPRAGVPVGNYIALLQIDGAESPVHFDPVLGRYDGPLLVVP